MMEKVAVAKSRNQGDTIINITRYGNVMCSRGSVIPLFVNQIQSKLPITITDPMMTRFIMTLDSAVDLVLFAFEHGEQGEIFVQKAPATSVKVLTEALTNIFGVPSHPINIIGTRHGEKLFEVLLSREEMVAAKELGDYYCLPPDLRDLNYSKFVEYGEQKISDAIEFTSHNTIQLDVSDIRTKLMRLDFIQTSLANEQSKIKE
jgi:UDP-glucose 4-epimerase